MRKKAASGVLASLRGSPYGTEYDYASSLAAALLDGLFPHPAWRFSIVSHLDIRDGYRDQNEFFRSLLENKYSPTESVRYVAGPFRSIDSNSHDLYGDMVTSKATSTVPSLAHSLPLLRV